MSRSKLSLIDRAEHGDAKAIAELLQKTLGSVNLKCYWVWQALDRSVPLEDIPEDDLHFTLSNAASAKCNGFLNTSETKLFQSVTEKYKSLHPRRAYVVLYRSTSEDKLERQYLESGCKAKSRHCAEELTDKLWLDDDEYLKAADLCFEACTWPFDEVSDYEWRHSDEELKKKGCKLILDHLLFNVVELKDAHPLLMKVYKNGDDEQKKESAEELEERTLDFLKPLFSKVESYAKQGLYKEAADLCAKLLAKKDELVKQLPKHDKIDKLFAPLASAREKYLASMLKPGVYIALAVLLGYFGAHDFYAGSPQQGKCKLKITFFSCGFLAPVSWIMSLFQLIMLNKNLGGSIQHRKQARHTRSWIITCIIIYVVILAGLGHVMKDNETAPADSPEARTAVSREGGGAAEKTSEPSSGIPTTGKPSVNEVSVVHSAEEPLVKIQPKKSPRERLLEAVKKGDANEVGALASEGADLSTKDASGNDLLTLAVQGGDSATIGVLLKKRARWATAPALLQEAVRNNNAVIVEALVTHGVDANTYKDDKGKTLLHLAVDAESLETVQALLKGNADPNARNNEGRTPIYSAIYRQNEAIIKALLKAGAKTKVQDKWSITPLEFAQERKSKSAIISLLKNNKK